ncbi:MAG: hydrogenase maturation protease [Polyangiaceae bacterium]|nr:hydrogenase maturation protease [Polyangiaceae bacterium]
MVGLGNDLLADDAVGVLAARELETRLAGRADVVATALHGVALLDVFLGYDRAIVIDAIQTGEHAPGTVVEIDTATLRPAVSPSPHYVGLPEMLAIAEQLGVEFPRTVRVFAVEVVDPHTIGGAMSPEVEQAVSELCERVERAVGELERK